MSEPRNSRSRGAWTPDDPATRYDSSVALVVVDVQNDFADPTGSLFVRGGGDVVPVINTEIERAIASGGAIFYTQDWHPEHTPHFAADGGIWPVHCVAETWGAKLHPQMSVRGPVVRKGIHGEDGYSGFSVRTPGGGMPTPTELDSELVKAGITRLVVCGLATDYCVKATALDGARIGYEMAILVDAVRAVDLEAGDGQRALDEMAAAGVKQVAAG